MSNAFIDIMAHAKFHFNRLMLTLIFGIRAWRTTEKAGPDRVKGTPGTMLFTKKTKNHKEKNSLNGTQGTMLFSKKKE